MAVLPALLLSSLVGGPAVAALADPPALTAEEAIERQQRALRSGAGIGCQRGADEDEIVVCGRNAPRVAVPPEPGERERLVAGEAPVGASAVDLGNCCGARGGIDVLRLGTAIAKGLGKIF